MSCFLLSLCHSGSRFFSRANSTSEYGRARVAATAFLRGHFVRFGSTFWRFPSASLPLPASGAKLCRAAAGSRVQNYLHRQFALPPDPSRAGSVPPPKSTRQSRGGGSAGTVARTSFLSWLRTRPNPLHHAAYLTTPTAMLQPNWLKFTSGWLPRRTF